MKKYLFSLLVIGYCIAGNTQNVGISAINPAARLHIRGTGLGNQLWLEDTVTSAIVHMSSNRTFIPSRFPSIGTLTNHPFSIVTFGVNRIIIDSIGRVGIGSTRPISLLANTDLNIIGSDLLGIGAQSINWRTNIFGYAQALYNNNPSPGGNGLAVKIAGATAGNRLLDLSVGNVIGTAGTPIMVVQGDGKVGINTGNPGATLSLGEIFPNQRAISIQDDYTSNNGYGIGIEPGPSTSRRMIIYTGTVNPQDAVAFGSYANTTFNEVMRVQNNGRVGINTNNPGATLSLGEIFPNQRAISIQDDYTGNNGYGIGIESGPNTSRRMIMYTGTANPQDAVAFGSYANTTFNEVMRVQNNGKVGINTNNPGATLSLGVTYPNQRAISIHDNYTGNNAYGIGIETSPGGTGSRMIIYTGTSNAQDAVAFGSYANTTFNEVMRMQNNGRIGIGTQNPNTMLANTGVNTLGSDGRGVNLGSINWAVNQEGYTQALYNGSTTVGASGLEIKLASTRSDNKILDLTTGTNDISGTSVMVVRGDGNVGIGTVAPSSRLQVNGTITATAPLNVVSDIRYKSNILPLTNAIHVVQRLKGVSYRLRCNEYPEMNFPSSMQIGFIAQEVEKVLPDVVTTDKTGNKSVSYTSVIPLLVEAIKEQQQQIDTLKQLVEELLKSKNNK